jgi:hypothetical protein
MAHSEMRWEMGFSASKIASTAFYNPKIVRATNMKFAGVNIYGHPNI